jgi:hypothetical protein
MTTEQRREKNRTTLRECRRKIAARLLAERDDMSELILSVSAKLGYQPQR